MGARIWSLRTFFWPTQGLVLHERRGHLVGTYTQVTYDTFGAAIHTNFREPLSSLLINPTVLTRVPTPPLL